MKTSEIIEKLRDRAKYDLLPAPDLLTNHLNWIAADALTRQAATIKALTEALSAAVYELERINKPGSRDKLALLREALAQAREEE